MTEQTLDSAELLTRAQSGDGRAFGELTEPYRHELHVHCYRILGSVQDAEDVLQETMLAAWRGIRHFEGRASLRFWLYRIATNQCLNALRGSGRRTARPDPAQAQADREAADRKAADRKAGPSEPAIDDEALRPERNLDALLHDLPDTAPGPEARYEARESISLAFVAALQHLPPRQRATLVLRDVLGFRAAETAFLLRCSPDSVNSSLRRARAGLAAHVPPGGLHRAPLPGTAAERKLLARVTDAFERGDIDALVAMLTEDVSSRCRHLPCLTARRGLCRLRIWPN